MLQENDKIVIDDKLVAYIFNDYFCSIASQIGFDDPITTTHDVMNKHRDHLQRPTLNFSCVNEDVITSKIRSIKIKRPWI